MEYTKLKCINQYKSESINPAKTPDTVFEMYSVPIYETGHPEYLRGDEIASNKAVVQENDILLCKINPRINRVWVVADESDKMNIASSEWIVIRNSEYNPEFLAWYFRTPKFQKLMTSEVTGIGGSLTRAQPKCVAEYPVPVLDRVKQDEIVDILNKCKFVIESRKQELTALDNLIKARFVEMFSSGEFPQVTIAELVSGKVQSVKKVFSPDDEIKYIDISSIDNKRNVMTGYTEYILSEAPSRAQQHIKKGDIVISTVRPNLRNVAMTEFEDDNLVASSGFCVLRASKCLPEYLLAIVCSDKFTDNMTKVVTGANYPAIKDSDIMGYYVSKPPMELQVQFAAFVHQIDKSKVAVQKALDETQVLFDSLMQKYFG